jgi:ATP-dependent 26S proteasome regulatory subunit
MTDRLEIITSMSQKMKTQDGINWTSVAERTQGWSGAAITELFRKAASEAVNRAKCIEDESDVATAATLITTEDIERALSDIDKSFNLRNQEMVL